MPEVPGSARRPRQYAHRVRSKLTIKDPLFGLADGNPQGVVASAASHQIADVDVLEANDGLCLVAIPMCYYERAIRWWLTGKLVRTGLRKDLEGIIR